MFIGSGYILVLDIFCQQLGKYSDIGYILPTIGRYILVLDIFCQQLGGYILILDIFCQQLADTFWYWIYSANNWQIYSGIRYILPTIGRYMSIMGGLCALRAQGCRLFIFWNVHLLKKSIFCNPTPSN